MARKQEEVTLRSGEHTLSDGTISNFSFGRDEGKILRFTEMSAVDLELWNIKQKALLTSGKVDKEVAQVAEEHSVSAAFFLYLAKDPARFIEHIKHFNELLFCYEIFDKAKGQYIKLDFQNIGKYIEETQSITYLRNKAMEYTSFFLRGSGSTSQKQTQNGHAA